jgi:hypothetical protein
MTALIVVCGLEDWGSYVGRLMTMLIGVFFIYRLEWCGFGKGCR